HWRPISGQFLVNFLSTPLALLTPLPLRVIVDSVIRAQPLPWFVGILVPESVTRSAFGLLVLAAGMYLLIACLNQLQALGSYALYTFTGEGLVLSLRKRLLEHAQRLSLSFHDSRGTADSLYRIHDDAPSIQWVIMDGLIPVVSSGLMFTAMAVVIGRINVELAVIALVVSPFVVMLGHVYDRRMGAHYSRVKELESGVLRVLQEIFASNRFVQAFAREEHETTRFSERSREGMQARIRLSVAEGIVILATNLAIAGGTALVLFVGARGVQAGRLSRVALTIGRGTAVGSSGMTGAGKSTLLYLLLRFYDPAGGCVLLDDVDLRDYRLADLRSQFAIVHQEPILLWTSVAENIAYG